MSISTLRDHDPLAGQWYPADPADLRALIERLQPASPVVASSGLIAVVAPHAGYDYSGRVAAKTLAHIPLNRFSRVLLLGPSHSVALPNRIALPDVSSLTTPLGSVCLDAAVLATLSRSPLAERLSATHTREHSLRIVLPLLQHRLGDRFTLAPVMVGQLDDTGIAAITALLRPLLRPDTLIIVSSDFTHYGETFGYVPFRTRIQTQIRDLDDAIVDRLLALDLAGFLQTIARTGATVCGRDPLALLLSLLPPGTTGRRVAYDTSGRQTADDRHSVSYVGLCFETAPEPSPLTSTESSGCLGSSAGRIGPRRARQALAVQNLARSETSRATIQQSGQDVTNLFSHGPRVVGSSVVPGQAPETPAAGLSEADGQVLLALARQTLTHAVRHRREPGLSDLTISLTPGIERPMGGFVTLKHGDRLRGCIGEIVARRPIWQVVKTQTVNAALHDGRFDPVQLSETDRLSIEISALTPPRPATAVTDIVLGRHGILLDLRGASSVFLPQVPTEQGWTLAETLEHLSLKAGLPADAWCDDRARFQVFEAQVFHEL